MTEQFNLHFTDLRKEAEVLARIIPGSGVTHLVIHGPDHWPWHSYSAPAGEMVQVLQELLGQARAIVAGHNPLSETDEWRPLGVPDGVRPEESPAVAVVPTPRAEITAARMQGLDYETALPLLIERFRNSDAKIYTALLADYYTLTRRHYKGTTAADLELDDLPADAPAGASRATAPSQLQRDLETIRPHLPPLIQNGQLVRGVQTRIAELLGITNAGASNRQRILKIVRILETRLLKLNSSTSSTAAEEPDEPDFGAIRAA